MSTTKKWFQRHSPYTLIGLAGVSAYECRRARLVGRFLHYVHILLSLLLLLQWELLLMQRLSASTSQIINVVIWLFFVIELVVLLLLVKQRARLLSENWLLPIIALLIVPYGWYATVIERFLLPMRPILAIYLLIPSITLLWRFLIDGRLRTTLLSAAIIILVFGFLAAGVDPHIKSAWDGIWWALATVSTVGYGDVVPTSALGRLLGAGLVVLGLGIFVMITANFLALYLQKKPMSAKDSQDALALVDRLDAIAVEQKRLHEAVLRLQRTLDKHSPEDDASS